MWFAYFFRNCTVKMCEKITSNWIIILTGLFCTFLSLGKPNLPLCCCCCCCCWKKADWAAARIAWPVEAPEAPVVLAGIVAEVRWNIQDWVRPQIFWPRDSFSRSKEYESCSCLLSPIPVKFVNNFLTSYCGQSTLNLTKTSFSLRYFQLF